MNHSVIDAPLLLFLVLVAWAALRTRDLLAAAFLLGGYSFLLCLLWSSMGAVDVALTEASVGAGVSTAFFLAAIHRTRRHSLPERPAGGAPRRRWIQLIALGSALVTGGFLFYASLHLPAFGALHAPAADHVSRYYIEHTLADSHVPNIVTAVLADYRSYDTMFETVVIFAAGVAVALLLRRPHAVAGAAGREVAS